MDENDKLIYEAIANRNKSWADIPNIPAWVDLDHTGLDQFFTMPSVAEYCYNNLLEIVRHDNQNVGDYHYIEPSAGSGVFYDLLPSERRTGIDIMPLRDDFIKDDFLSWDVGIGINNYIVVGNPPFGYRAWLALAFINHAATFSDYVGMIMPMSFQSDGKGSPKHRVKGMKLVHSEELPNDSFISPCGKSVKINTLWQVWKKGENIQPKQKTCNEWVDIFTVDQSQNRLCGAERMKGADYFLQRTFYKEPPNLVRSFSEVKYVCGYGIKIKKNKREITDFLNKVDWVNYSNLAAHNCRHISMYHIVRALTDSGYTDN